MKRSMLALMLVGVLAGSAWAADYQIDPVHSMLIYRIKHLQSSYSYGRFNNPTGTFSFDASAPEKSTFELSVPVNNLDTANEKRDAHLKSPDFFNAKQYPTISFKSRSVKKTGDDKLEVTGDLSLHGVTKSVVVPLTIVGTSKGMGGETRTGFEGNVQIKRSDFDMKGLPDAVGDDVTLIFSLEGIQK